MSLSVKKILITHAPPADENSPYHALAKKWKLVFDFNSFVQVAGVSTSEFRKQNTNPLDFTAIIFTSKYSVDHYFRICKDLRMEMPADMKYFCLSDATAKYLQKYIVIRKRKLFVGEKTADQLIDILKKHSKDKFLYPCGEVFKSQITDYLEQQKFHYKIAMVYQTEACDLSNLNPLQYDIIAFFSPASIEALLNQFPDYRQTQKLIAVFGPTTQKAAEEAGLRIDISAPTPETPSMTMAIENFLKANEA